MPIVHSALCEAGFACPQAVAEEATLALGWKPTAVDTAYPLCDPTHHYLLTIRKVGAAVTVWKQDVELGGYTTSAATYAELLAEALAAFTGTAEGYVSRLAVVERALDFTGFYQPSGAVSGLWGPRALEGLGVHTLLEFADAADLGHDSSGNGNHWVLAGASQSMDTPTNNFATLNPLGIISAAAVLSDGMLSVTGTGAGAPWSCGISTLGVDFPFYFEVRLGAITAQNYTVAGIIVDPMETSSYEYPGETANSWGIQSLNGNLRVCNNGSSVSLGSWGATYEGDVYGLAADPVSGKVWVRKNDAAWFGDGDPAAGSSPTFSIVPGTAFPAVAMLDNVGKSTADFGQNGFAYAPPPGFRSLCSDNLPKPALLDVGALSGVLLRTGTGGEAEVSSLPFAPDFVQIKSRGYQDIWVLTDTARGANRQLSTNYTTAETTAADMLTAFLPDGYALGPNVAVNRAGTNLVDVVLKASPEAGLCMVRYTGDGTPGRAVAHDLGRTPTFMLIKRLDAAGDWTIYHTALGAAKRLAFSYAAAVADATVWNDTEPTASGFTLGDSAAVNSPGGEYVAYVFTDSDVFRTWSFRGNALDDGPFVDLGGRPLSLLFYKAAEYGSSPWYNYDAVRDPYDRIDDILNPNLYAAEQTNQIYYRLAFTSRGFKPLTSNAGYNGGGQLLVGLAILDQTKYANAF
jgi:hypothetical protein